MNSIEICLIGFVAGLLATFCMDLLAQNLIRLQLIQLHGLQFGPPVLGRWFLHLLRSKAVRVSDIRLISSLNQEAKIGVLLHYAIGGFLGSAFFLGIHGPFHGFRDSLLSYGLVYGAATNAFPWLLMFPSMGFGFFASRLPMQKQILILSGLNHLVFGLALGLVAWGIQPF